MECCGRMEAACRDDVSSPEHSVSAVNGVIALDWQDPFLITDQLTEDERVMRDATHA